MKTLIDEDGDVHWPKMGELTSNLRENFAKEDQVEESLRKLETMRQDGRTAEEVVNEFRILKSRAKIEDNALTVRMFRRVLNPSLAMKIMTDPNEHNTLKDPEIHGSRLATWMVFESHSVRSDLPRRPSRPTRGPRQQLQEQRQK
jgi:hypothetical protein